MSTLDWRPFFPLKAPRQEQVIALDELCSSVEQGKRLLVAELGTGVGKSAVAVCMSRWLAAREVAPLGFSKGAVVLTSQKVLQDQYIKTKQLNTVPLAPIDYTGLYVKGGILLGVFIIAGLAATR